MYSYTPSVNYMKSVAESKGMRPLEPPSDNSSGNGDNDYEDATSNLQECAELQECVGKQECPGKMNSTISSVLEN